MISQIRSGEERISISLYNTPPLAVLRYSGESTISGAITT